MKRAREPDTPSADSVRFQGAMRVPLFGKQVELQVTICHTWLTLVNFYREGRAYAVEFRSWAGVQLNRFLVLSFRDKSYKKWYDGLQKKLEKRQKRPPSEWSGGDDDESDDDDEAEAETHAVIYDKVADTYTLDLRYSIDHEHECVDRVLHAIRDTFRHVDAIAKRYPENMLSYAVWHSDVVKEIYYEDLIERLASQVIMDAKLIGPAARFELIHLSR